ncbi:MAG: low molecular weight protein-tyrosine-phosphatase [Cellulomonadaceae bacterium]
MTRHEPFRIMTVCHGNICRSPMAEVVLRDRLGAAGLEGRVEVDSSGVSDEEHGNPIDRRAQAVLREHGYDVPRHRAHQITRQELADRDLVLVMTAGQESALRRRLPEAEAGRVRMLRRFDSAAPAAAPAQQSRLDIADPWYGGPEDFEVCLDQIEAASGGVVDYVRREIGRTGAER